MKTAALVAASLALLGLLFAGVHLTGIRNDLVAEREAIRTAWSQVEVVLERRADLIPNLVSTVQGFAEQERSVIDSVTQARAAMLGAQSPEERIQGNLALDAALGRLLVVVENYPELRSSENFLRLQDELAGTENRIAVERRKYNEAVQRYNTKIALFPNNIVAGLFRFEREDAYFQTAPAAREVPKVELSAGGSSDEEAP